MPMVDIHRDGSVAVVTMDRPPANAIELEMAGRLREAIASTENDRAVGAVVLTGRGGCFCGGLDLKVVPGYGPADQHRMLRALGEMVTAWYATGLPVVAAVNGHAVAAGTLLCLCTDYRIAPDGDCRFGLTGARVGIPYPEAAMHIIRAELAPAAARRLALSARTWGTEDALANGVIDEIQPRDNVIDRAIEVARDLAAFPDGAYARTKHALRTETVLKLDASLETARRAEEGTWIAGRVEGWSSAEP